jgi:hypothetical protein
MRALRSLLVGLALLLLATGAASAAPTYKWSTNVYNVGSTASLTTDLTSGCTSTCTIASGDLLVVVACWENATDPGTVTPPSGFTTQLSVYGWEVRCAIATKIAGGSETGAYTSTVASAYQSSWALLDYSGINATPIDGTPASTVYTTSYVTAIIAPSVTTTASGSLLFNAWPEDWNSGTATCGAGCTDTMRVAQASTSSGRPAIQIGDQVLGAAGASGTQTLTAQYSNNSYGTYTIAFKAAGGGAATVSRRALTGVGN